VLATVTTGLHVSWYGPMLISAATRIQAVFFWDFFIYVIEGMVFLITGLQARTLIAASVIIRCSSLPFPLRSSAQ
jgi:hypothetical protein